MAYTIDLRGSRAKLKRGKEHIDAFHKAVEDKLGPHPILYPLRRQFETDQGAVIYRIDGIIEIDDNWSLIIGDAVHNLRGALDHLAWQLALRYFKGVEANAMKAKASIMFPIVHHKNAWPKERYRTYMMKMDAAKLKRFQPFNVDPVARGMRLPHPLEMLGSFSNADKHRAIQLTYSHAAVASWDAPQFRDCVLNGVIIFSYIGATPKPGDEVCRIPVRKTGNHPDVDFHTTLSGFIAVREHWNVEDALTLMAQRIEAALNQFPALVIAAHSAALGSAWYLWQVYNCQKS